MGFRWVEHTGEQELAIEAPTAEAALGEALLALREALGGPGSGEPERRAVEVHAPDEAALLAEWLAELLYLADAEGFVPDRAVRIARDGASLSAVVEGRHGRPSPLVKGVTYHRLSLAPADGGWRGTVVLDV